MFVDISVLFLYFTFWALLQLQFWSVVGYFLMTNFQYYFTPPSRWIAFSSLSFATSTLNNPVLFVRWLLTSITLQSLDPQDKLFPMNLNVRTNGETAKKTQQITLVNKKKWSGSMELGPSCPALPSPFLHLCPFQHVAVVRDPKRGRGFYICFYFPLLFFLCRVLHWTCGISNN